jgi:hypothetical protein
MLVVVVVKLWLAVWMLEGRLIDFSTAVILVSDSLDIPPIEISSKCFFYL